MSDRSATHLPPLTGTRKTTLDQRIEELRARKPADINHGEALLLQGIATASLRGQRLAQGRVDLD